MAGRRPLTLAEERRLLPTLRVAPPRDRALVTALQLTGFRVSEILSLPVGAVWRHETIVDRLTIPPRHLKGHRGSARSILVLPELRRALEAWLRHLRRRLILTPDLPLFLSREDRPDGTARALSRDSARRILHRILARAGIVNDGRLGTHTLRKTWARKVYDSSGHDLMVLRASLHHANVATTQRYLDVARDAVDAAIRKCDFTRGPQAAPAIAETRHVSWLSRRCDPTVSGRN